VTGIKKQAQEAFLRWKTAWWIQMVSLKANERIRQSQTRPPTEKSQSDKNIVSYDVVVKPKNES
jgi:hypothetical protein